MGYRLRYLDSLRGVACLMVMIMHFYEQTDLNSLSIFRYLGIGQVGVVIFFLISGFVIPFSIKDRPGQVAPFVVSRFFRLYPAFWISLLLAFTSKEFISNEMVTIKTIFANITMAPGLFRQEMLYPVYWTLLVELFFYLLCILMYIVGVLYNNKTKFIFSCSCLVISLFSAFARYKLGTPSPVGIISAISLMFFSGLWREWQLNGDSECKRFSLIYLLCFFVVFPMVAYFSYGDGRTYEGCLYYIVNYFVGIILFVLFTSKVKLGNNYLYWLGMVSYSAYLMHPFVLDLFVKYIGINGPFSLYKFLCYIFVSLVLAYISYKIVEKPSHVFGSKVRDRIMQK
ncbi:acyltransferase family protein [Klebsiella aerogenes]|uniref:acyltransferase family protein n=1 Tax=Klebsiella aerogenes TaxID=548 RepID=UPI003A8CC081